MYCYIFGAIPIDTFNFKINKNDIVIAADAGIKNTHKFNIKPDFIIGDFDSLGYTPTDSNTIIHPIEKDDTDTGICLQTALDQGYREILIIGGLGGRLDHTMSNIQLITGKCHLADRISIRDKSNSCTVITNGSVTLPYIKNQYVSIFSMTEKSTGVTTSGLKYPLDNATMVYGSTLGTSNEIIDKEATISVKDGRLLIITSMEGQK